MTWLLNRGDPCKHSQGHGTDPVTVAEPGVGLTGGGELGRVSPTVAASWTLLSVLCTVPRERAPGPFQPARLCFASDRTRLAVSSPFLIGARERNITEKGVFLPLVQHPRCVLRCIRVLEWLYQMLKKLLPPQHTVLALSPGECCGWSLRTYQYLLTKTSEYPKDIKKNYSF